MDIRMGMGERIKAERERLGMTIPRFAEVAGAAKNTVIDWQNGKSTPPASKLAALARSGIDTLYVLIGRRSIAPVGMTEDEIERFNRLLNLFWSASDKTRGTIEEMLSALHAQDVQRGTARGVRQPPTPKPATPPKPKPPRKAAAPKPAVTKIAGSQLNFQSSVGQVAVGNITNKTGKKR